MDRRRFLKYVGATAAVIGASALGLDLPKYLGNQQQTVTRGNSSTLISPSSSPAVTALASYSKQKGLAQLVIDKLGEKLGDKLTANNQALVDYLSSMGQTDLVSPAVLQIVPSGYKGQAVLSQASCQRITCAHIACQGEISLEMRVMPLRA